ncbi:maleylpyruvate isomerase family mycothiol-dependent enzyme [Streptomyces sp. NBC_01023]|uniref:maleylpyruvate isomerase family mycothiol-dependent enzyme n=1 Tax=Streptomyces sp. NBC_01023 TaxID=2903724 RepID=UPI00386E97C8|nr:maleylpyruvate isomerase family mycothiol-dependent enzyme [Streptomyces sp. NBC_01023]
MTSLSHDRLCAEITTQSELLRACVQGSDLTAPVPSCPGWNLGQLLTHLGEAHRWADEIVRTKAVQPPSDRALRDLSPVSGAGPEGTGAWLADGAERLAATLREAGPDAKLWSPVSGADGRTGFYARRMAHETLIHRADATLAVGTEFTAGEEVAVDAFDEWLELGSLPQLFDIHPEQRELLGPGRTLHFHATDTGPQARAAWLVDLTGETVVWRRAHEKAAVAVRGPLTELLLVLYRRRSPHSEGIEVLGDGQLLDFWQERVGFG